MDDTIQNTLTISETARLLGINPLTVRRRLKAGELKGNLVKGKNGEQWFIYRDSALEYIQTKNKKNDKGTLNKSSSNKVHFDYKQIYTDLQGAMLRLGQVTNEVENYKRMLTSGDQKFNEVNQSLIKTTQSLRKWKIIGIVTSSALILTLAFAIAGIIFL